MEHPPNPRARLLIFFLELLCLVAGEFKVLVVLAAVPAASPLEPMLCKQLIAEVVLINLIREILISVSIWSALFWIDVSPAIGPGDVGIIKRVDVHGNT